MNNKTLIGPFSQIVTMQSTSIRGAIKDESLGIISDGGVIVSNGKIEQIGLFKELDQTGLDKIVIEEPMVLTPGFIDAHTHICYGGSRAGDYALRVGGASYQDILKNGGGIHDTVSKTREQSEDWLTDVVIMRAQRHLKEGITTCEVKSGYGLSVEHELKMLRAIKKADAQVSTDLVSTCLAAHVCPKEFNEASDYLNYISTELFPVLKEQELTNRIDIFTEDGAFNVELSREYLLKAKEVGFHLTVHADQFTSGGSELAVELGALSADHLEASTDEDIQRLGASDVVSTVLPGASLGLGMHYSGARKLLDAGAILAIATDWNPGSAPMGDLLVQTALIGAAEKLSIAECLAGITFRAAKALGFNDRGRLSEGMKADFIGFSTEDYRDLFYYQGKLKPKKIWKDGLLASE